MPTSRKRKKNKKKRHPNPNNLAPGAYDRMTEKMKKNGFKGKLRKKQHKHRVSDLVIDFLSEELATCKSEEEERGLIPMGIMAWNIASFDEKQREEQLQDLLQKVEEKTGFADDLEEVMRDLINKKITYYNKYKYFIISYDITSTPGGGLHLSVVSTEQD